MSSRTLRLLSIAVTLIVAALVLLLWPAPDPLAHVDTVAIRVSNEPSASRAVDFESELELVLSGRHIRVVSDEADADLVLSLDDFRVALGDVEISLTSGSLRGKASAVCIVTDVSTGKIYTMDFLIQVENGDVRAELVGRKFWEFWK